MRKGLVAPRVTVMRQPEGFVRPAPGSGRRSVAGWKGPVSLLPFFPKRFIYGRQGKLYNVTNK